MTSQMKHQPWLMSNSTLGRNWYITANLIQIFITFTLFILKNLTLTFHKNLIWSLSHQIVCVSSSLAVPRESLAHRRNVASLSLFYWYYFERYSSELDQLVPFPPYRGRSTRYANRQHDVSVTIPDVIRMSMATVPFLAHLDSGILCLQNAFISPMI